MAGGQAASCFRDAVTIPPDQAETAAFLRDLAGADPVETHISLVFVGTDTVWKLKKAVRLSFLDFSVLEDRRKFIGREFELNAHGAPGLYRDIVPVVRREDGTLSLGGEGTVVDWVLRMSRVPSSDFLNIMAQAGRLDPPLLDAIADAVAAYHAQSIPLPEACADMRWMARGNVTAARDAGLPPEAIDAWGAEIERTLSALEPWLRQRVRDGFVRRAHGDLHLGNICLWRGQPTLFDALEFDEALATIDVGYDLAFLLMDLDRRVGRSASNRAMNRYIARTGDAALVRGMPAFLSLRALVRAHVSARSGDARAGKSYLTAALAYLRPPPPFAIAIGGLPGTGKSTVARLLAPDLGASPGALIVRSDEIRKRQSGVSPERRLPPAAYTREAGRSVFETLAATLRIAAEAGQCVIADATFLSVGHRAMVRQACMAAGVPFRGFWLSAPMNTLERRVATRVGDASDATVEVLRSAAANDPGPLDWTPIDASDAASAADRIRNLLPSES